ncbi:Cytochrome c oxidase subunit 2 [Candidatus Desulfarcum epimagneticum]|uniref:Cytochrome c oxidase subunit 2 n=1 Tax=uncultured Desulfobacteraceae bacterium TaxID=218296 RepID=A0A484HE79_9BACT|nr:Cytochrome c oxidase subunit 2 [uncultured Desulfobacteraceae bacterium]
MYENIVNPARGVDEAFYYIFGASFALLALITGAMVFFAVRYRRSRHPKAADIRGNWKLELIWTLIPALIVMGMFKIGWSSYLGLRNVPKGAIEVEVYAQKYSWIFVYPNDKETENEMAVPLGKPVKLNVTSEDVLHSLFIPAFRIKVDAVPGMKTYAWFYPDEKGEYDIHCSEFCGSGHADMNGVVRVVSENEYREWLESEEE